MQKFINDSLSRIKNGIKKLFSNLSAFNERHSGVLHAIGLRAPLVIGLLLLSAVSLHYLNSSVTTVNINDGVKNYTVKSLSADIDEIVQLAGFKPDEYKIVSTERKDNYTNVNIVKTFPVYITMGSNTIQVSTPCQSVGDILKDAGYQIDDFDMVQPAADTLITQTSYIDFTNIDYITTNYTEEIPFSYKTIYSDALAYGETELKDGSNGVKQVYCVSKVVNGIETERNIESEIVLTNAIAGIKTVGISGAVSSPASNVTAAATPLAPSETADVVWGIMKGYGWSDVIAAGILGNMMAECGGQTLNLNWKSYDKGFYGLCQWSAKYYPAVQGKDVFGQMDFLLSTLNMNIFANCSTPEQAALVFAQKYERCASFSYARRQVNARNAFAHFAE